MHIFLDNPVQETGSKDGALDGAIEASDGEEDNTIDGKSDGALDGTIEVGSLTGLPDVPQPAGSIPEEKQASLVPATESQCASHLSVLQLPQFKV